MADETDEPFRLRIRGPRSRSASTTSSHTVARRYDLMNDLMSAGLHRLWKDALDHDAEPAAAPAVPPSRRRRRHRRRRLPGPRRRRPGDPRHGRSTSTATCCAVGRERAEQRGHRWPHRLRRGATPRRCRSAGRLVSTPTTIAFGIRNVPRGSTAALAGGASRPAARRAQFLCLEFSPRRRARRSTRSTTTYSFNLIPPPRPASSPGDAELLPLSRRVDPPLPEPGRRSADMIAAAGFRRATLHRPCTGGVVALHSRRGSCDGRACQHDLLHRPWRPHRAGRRRCWLARARSRWSIRSVLPPAGARADPAPGAADRAPRRSATAPATRSRPLR